MVASLPQIILLLPLLN